MNRLNLDQLSAFLHVVRLGSVTKAADALHLTQPAITARLRNLQTAMGTELFDRSAGGLRLTRKGEMLLAYAERFERLEGLVQRDIVAPDSLEGRLRIGVSETVAQCWLPDLITRLHGRYPSLEIEFNVDISINLRAALLDRAVDLAVLLGPISEYSVNNIDLPDFDLAWYVAAQTPEPEDPTGHFRRPVLTYARQTRPFRELRKLLQDRVDPGVKLFPSSSLSACFRLVEAELGVAALPRALGREFVARGTIREFDPGWVPPPLHFTASYRAEPPSPLVESAADLALEAARDYARA